MKFVRYEKNVYLKEEEEIFFFIKGYYVRLRNLVLSFLIIN